MFVIFRPQYWLSLGTLLILGCHADSEEIRLRKQVNVTDTHLYVALKLAVSPNTESTEARRVRELLTQLDRELNKPTPSSATQALQTDVAAVAEIASTLWALRQAGRAEVELWRDSRVTVLDSAMLSGVPEGQRRTVEHAILLLGLVALRLHPQAPAPVPAQTVLYEAYLFGETPIDQSELEGVARSAQAIIYARERYCELAAGSTRRLSAIPLTMSGRELRNLAEIAAGLGRAAAHAPPAAALVAALVLADNLPWATRLLAFASTARCLEESSLPDAQRRATVEWEHAVNVAEAAGFPPAELAFLRAYLAYQREDWALVQRELAAARTSKLLTAAERTQLDELAEHFDPKDRTKMDRFLEPLFLSQWVIRLVHHRLDNAGFYRALGELPVFRVVRDVFQASAVPDRARIQAAGSGGWEWLESHWRQWTEKR
jgi:hypothetical protein